MTRIRKALARAVLAWATSGGIAHALDKQAPAHGGEQDEPTTGFGLSGALTYGVSLYNPTYGARPDNSGRALFRYAAHVDVDLIGQKLSIPIDVNVFTDRQRKGLAKMAPTEVDGITGLTSTWELGAGGIEVGARVEHDRPADRGGFTQTYADVRTRLLYSLAKAWPALGKTLQDGDVSGWLTLGWFAKNPSYAARPDNTGLALFRYAGHVELSVYDDLVSAGVDATMFTARSRPLAPSELDLTPELIVHVRPFEVHLAYERDMPLDRGGLVQEFVYVLGVWNFDLTKARTAPFETRGQVLSP